TAEIAGDIGLGTVDGLANLATDAVRIDLLHVPAGLARLVGSAWQGGGGLSGLSAIFWEPGRAQVALAVDQAIDGDFRASAASTVEAVGVGVATGIALGELGAAAVEAGGEIWNERGGIDFGKSSALYPVKAGQKSIVQIDYTGARSSDFKAANQAAGFERTPQGYSWHHLDDYDPATNRGTMQLVETPIHQANAPHSGGVKQSEIATGVKYGR
ncbi:MAG: HNH endonuclease, partial [Byssovorax sp.]